MIKLNVHHVAHPSPQVLVMPTTLPRKSPGGYRRQSGGVGIESALLAATLFVALAFNVTTGVLPAQLVLPAVSVIVVFSGLLLGAAALLMRRQVGDSSDMMLDVSGALVFFGFAAAVVCDKTEAMRVLSVLPGV